MDTTTIACDLTALEVNERQRRAELFGRLRGRTKTVDETDAGYRLSIAGAAGSWMTAAELVELERRCCPFLRFELSVDESGEMTLQLDGGEGVKEFLALELGLPPHDGTPRRLRHTLALLLGPLVAAAASLFCCVGPLLLAAVGLASSGLGVAVSSDRVPIAAVAVAFIAAGYLVLYRPIGRRARPEVEPGMRLLFWVSSGLALAGALASLLV